MSDSATLWTVTRQVSLSMGFSRRCWSGFQGIFPTQGSNPCFQHLSALVGEFYTISATREARDDSSTVLFHCFPFLIEFLFDNLYFPKIVHFICFLNLSSRRIEPMFVLSIVVSFASAKTMEQASSKYLLYE